LLQVAAATLAAVGACSAQTPSTWRWQQVPGAGSVAFAVLWQHGYDDDVPGESGAVLALAECRLLRARRAVPEAVASGVQVGGDATVAFVLVPTAEAARGVAFCGALLDDTLAVDDDLVARAIARAALAADDAEWLYPGEVLASRARRHLLAGGAARGVAGSAVAVQALTPARLRALLRQPVGVLAVGVGSVPAAVQQQALSLPLPPKPRHAQPSPPPIATAVDAAPVADVQPHPRVDGPFVAIAFVVPPAVDHAALAVAVEVARGRAARTLRLRGGEAQARAPLVAWSWLRGEPLLRFHRRGPDGGEPDQPWGELDALLADLVERPPTAVECDTAVRTLRAEFGLVPPTAAVDGAALPGWAMASLLARWRRIDEAAVTAVTAAAAHAALRATCGGDRVYRGGLVPPAAAVSR
jgi:hypothetical protein